MARIYLAGPLFTAAEQKWNGDLTWALQKLGHSVFLPQAWEPRNESAREVFLRDTDEIATSDFVVANVDGPDVDSGTAWELGYAYSLGIPIIIHRTDIRKNEEMPNEMVNLMITQSATEQIRGPVQTSPRQMAKEIDKVIRTLETKNKKPSVEQTRKIG